MKEYSNILQPILIGGKKAKNRIEVAPAAPFLAGHDGSLSPEYYAHIEALAASGAGVVTLGVTPVDPGCKVGSRVMCLGSESFVSDFNEVAELIHRYDALASAEVVYSRYMLSPPSAVVNETSTEEVEDMIRCFVDGVDRLRRAGFDMALIHGGHGNVPSMFFNQKINQRTDRFGGPFEGRCRFALELLWAIRERCGSDIALEYRISAEEMTADGTTFEETLAFAKAIEPHIDLLHVSRGLLEDDDLVPYINAPVYLPKAMNLPFARRFKEELRVPVTVVGSFDLALAEDAIGAGDVDMVSMVRTVYADTRCVEKARLGKADDIRPCIRCNVCIDRTHTSHLSVRCAVNPRLGRESRFPLGKAPEAERKTIAIVGGGPAGLEAARTLSARGHKAIVFEKEKELGGLFKMASAAAMKGELKSYLDWSVEDVVCDTDIEVRLGVEATPDLVAADNPYAVLLALGSIPVVPEFPLDDSMPSVPVYWVGEAEDGSCDLGDDVLIVGAGMTGLEFALSLARQGRKVTLVDSSPFDQVGKGATAINLRCIKNLLAESDVAFHCGWRMQGVSAEGAVVGNSAGATRTLSCDSVVLSCGFKPEEEKLRAFEERFSRCYRIGDCNGRGGTLFNATQSAFDKVMLI